MVEESERPAPSEPRPSSSPSHITSLTKVLMPVMLEDYHRVMSERKGDKVWYTLAQIQSCMAKVISVDLGQRVEVRERGRAEGGGERGGEGGGSR
jgi:Cft2 family RNA processing exonuclease